ncbi:hypothetical protein, partial [Actinomadura madurae]|uniref:hypothetical protein n=1 Tax=Actinomadura madurae TaxID=1993 RepID=UPI0020D24F88
TDRPVGAGAGPRARAAPGGRGTPGQVRARSCGRRRAHRFVPAAPHRRRAVPALGAGMHAAMVRKGVLPDGFGLSLSPLPALAAVATAVLAAAVTSLVAALRCRGSARWRRSARPRPSPAGCPGGASSPAWCSSSSA